LNSLPPDEQADKLNAVTTARMDKLNLFIRVPYLQHSKEKW